MKLNLILRREPQQMDSSFQMESVEYEHIYFANAVSDRSLAYQRWE